MNEHMLYDLVLQVTVAVCVTALIIVVLLVANKQRTVKQQTLQKLIDSDKALTAEVLTTIGFKQENQAYKDLRKGVMLTICGVVLTLTFMPVGGFGWIFGFLPITLGLVYLGLSRSRVNKS